MLGEAGAVDLNGTNQTAECSDDDPVVPQSDWGIVEKGWKAHVLGEAEHTFKDALEAVTTLRVRLSISSSSRIDRA